MGLKFCCESWEWFDIFWLFFIFILKFVESILIQILWIKISLNPKNLPAGSRSCVEPLTTRDHDALWLDY